MGQGDEQHTETTVPDEVSTLSCNIEVKPATYNCDILINVFYYTGFSWNCFFINCFGVFIFLILASTPSSKVPSSLPPSVAESSFFLLSSTLSGSSSSKDDSNPAQGFSGTWTLFWLAWFSLLAYETDGSRISSGSSSLFWTVVLSSTPLDSATPLYVGKCSSSTHLLSSSSTSFVVSISLASSSFA